MANSFRIKPKPETTESQADRSSKKNDGTKKNPIPLISAGILTLFALILLVSFISYFFSGAADQDFIQKSITEIELKDGKTSQNAIGAFGAKISHLFIYTWFGLSAFLIIPPLVFIAFRLVFKEDIIKVNLFKFCIASVFYTFFFSLIFGYFVSIFDLNTIVLSGLVGLHANKILFVYLGYGSILFILVLLLAWMIFFHGFTTIDDYILANYLPKKKFKNPFEREEGDDEYIFSARPKVEPEPVTTQNNFVPEPPKPVFEPSPIFESYEEEEEEELEELEEEDLEEEEIEEEEEEFDFNFDEDSFEEEEEEEFFENSASEPQVSFTIEPNKPEVKEIVSVPQVIPAKTLTPTKVGEENTLLELYGEYDPKLDLASYQYPHIHLLADYGGQGAQVSHEELQANKNKIVETLENFSIKIASIKASIGPTVTLYEIIPDAGVRISKIKNLEDDIALSLAALGIRIIAPMPGKGTIGIEVPNKNREMVSMKSIISSEKFQNSGFELPIILGKTISNEIYVTDLAKMPHLLMAGATGQGKSVGLNVILTSLLYKKHPSEVKFILVDPKKVELTLFNKIERHFLAMLPNAEEAIITDTKKVIHTLNSLCIEMDQRYDLLKDASVRNIKEYNAKFVKRKLNPEKGHKHLPYIVLVIDELADLMMTAGKEVEQPIARLAQLARAIGIHLIVATQRPSVNVITGLIKANFPARLSFKVTAKVDSRTIMDTGGAEQLVGNGDMLLSMGSEMIRLQCPFVDTPEVENVCEFIGEQRAYPNAYLLPEFFGDDDNDVSDLDVSDLDVLFEEAAKLLVIHQQGSTSLIQRKMKLGYNRAGRIVDQLEAAGILGPFEGSKAREVLVKDLNHLDEILKGLKK